jgi:diacylglycerol kinase (ATP)
MMANQQNKKAVVRPVAIIFNPNSTGDGEANARVLQKQLEAAGLKVELMPTKHAGHAVTLAKKFADTHKTGMVISSSGDGGYHEVVNGIMQSKHPSVITGVLPSGNANDHYHSVHHGNTVQRIANATYDEIDVLKVSTKAWTHYAHSYVGLGMTPQIGEELTKATLNPMREAWLVVKNLFQIKPVKIRQNGKVRRYNNVVFSNTPRMSKYLTLSTKASVTDGVFEITRVKATNLWELLRHLFRATANQIDDAPQAAKYSCTVLRATKIQLDGEVYDIPQGDEVVITCEHKKLRCIV